MGARYRYIAMQFLYVKKKWRSYEGHLLIVSTAAGWAAGIKRLAPGARTPTHPPAGTDGGGEGRAWQRTRRYCRCTAEPRLE